MKNRPRIWVNTLVKNEERWIWFSLHSVLPFVEKVLVWDTGSSDKTVRAIKTIKSKKIEFKKIGDVAKKEYGKVRQKMLEKTESDWVLIVDGDEIWPISCALQLIKEINKAPNSIKGLCVRPINFAGDIRFIHPETFKGQTPHAPKGIEGFFSTRVFRRDIPGLHVAGPYGKEAFYDNSGKTLRENKDTIKYLPNVYYWHMTYLPRSSSRNKDRQVMMRTKKRKFEIGIPRPKWVKIPKVFFKKRPKIVPNPFYKMNIWQYFKALIQTPLKKIKRKFLFPILKTMGC
jgi:glycosyltransferase involved in cell wall biosynthesis